MRPYFEVLTVAPESTRSANPQRELHKLRRPEDPFTYEVVQTSSFEDAMVAAIVNTNVQAVLVYDGFPFKSRHALASLGDLLDGATVSAHDPGLTVPDLVDRICTGGWPGLIDARPGDARRWLRDYLDDAIHVDLTDFGPRRRDPLSPPALACGRRLHARARDARRTHR